LLADVDAPIKRVVFSRGVEAWRDPDGGWASLASRPSQGTVHATLAALGLRPVAERTETQTATAVRGADVRSADVRGAYVDDACAEGVDPVALAAERGLAPLLLVDASDTVYLVSAAGAVGWRAPLERLYFDKRLGARARRLRFLLDAMEHHAVRAAESYVAAASAARRTAMLFGGRNLTTLDGQTALFVELDALLGAVQRTYSGAARLLAAAFPHQRGRRGALAGAEGGSAPASRAFDDMVLWARGAPPELRETLLAAWELNGAHIPAYRRALRARDAASLGHAPVRVTRLACNTWAVTVPVRSPTLSPRRTDALKRAWALATDAMRVVSLVVYAAAER
jgi:hypothetical protein